jgi:hypothetical protein
VQLIVRKKSLGSDFLTLKHAANWHSVHSSKAAAGGGGKARALVSFYGVVWQGGTALGTVAVVPGSRAGANLG